MTFTFRFAEERDAAALLAIYAPYVVGTSITFEYTVPSLEEFAGRVSAVTQRLPWIVCESGGEIVGYAYAAPYQTRAAFQWDAEISVYLKENFKRRGIARALYRAIKLLLTAQGYYNLYALIAYPNDESIGFHKSQGFQFVGIYPMTGYKLNDWHDLAAMELPLQDSFRVPEPTKALWELPAEILEKALDCAGEIRE